MSKDGQDVPPDIDQNNGQDNEQEDALDTAGEGSDTEALLLSLQDAQAKADEYWNELLRTRAELSNLQRRAERDVSNAHKYALERFASELLPVIDSLELGLNAASDGGTPDSEKLREGMELTLKLLLTATAKFGITPVDPRGEKFNPERHQAMSMQPAEGVEPNTVLTVYQKGWLLNERLIRPAMVVVAGPAENPGAAPDRSGGIDEMA